MFDTETAQKMVLEKMMVLGFREKESACFRGGGCGGGVEEDEKFRFKGRVLRIIQPDEADSIRFDLLD